MVSTIQTAQNGLFIAGDDLPAFCASVLPVIRPYIRLEGDTDGLEPYQPRALECAVYLDAPDAETITARLECRYGDDVFNPYAEGPTAPFRDRLGELKARLILQKYFTSFRPEDGRLLFHGDEEQIYRFVAGGVEISSGLRWCTPPMDLKNRPHAASQGLGRREPGQRSAAGF